MSDARFVLRVVTVNIPALSHVSLYKPKILMTTEAFWFFSLLKIHLATQLVRLSRNLRRGRRVDDEDRTWHAGRQWLPPLQPTKTQWQSTSCSSSYNSDFSNTSQNPTFLAHPLLHTLRPAPKKYSISTERAFLSVGLLHQGNLCFMVAIPLPASDWKFNRQALEMLLLTLSPHIHKCESIKQTGLYVQWV